MLEILAPAGNTECAEAAINSGADAIYLGQSAFSARQSAGNFDEAAFRAIVAKAHLFGVKVYVAMNTLVKDGELEDFLQAVLFAWDTGADAIIMQDVFLGKYVHEQYPEIVLHLSTQAGVCTLDGAKLAKLCGFSRVILARETPLSEIARIAEFMETEVFVQGALCTCFSGQCYFSSFAGGNSGNRGRCKQPCRKQYAYNRNGGTEKCYALSLSDLSVGEDIQKLIQAGVLSFKIEGRMRRAEYVAAAVLYYRKLLDEQKGITEALSDLKRTYNRGNYTRGLAFGQDKRFLSPFVQGHLGEKVGVVKVINGKYLVDSVCKPGQGDAFKILREGREIGGAVYLKQEGRNFVIASKSRLKNGDGVFITTDTEVNARVLNRERRAELPIKISFIEGEFPLAECGAVRAVGDNLLQTAQSRPLTVEEIKTCFSKTDGFPVTIRFDEIRLQGNIFIAKSELNAFRRKFFAELIRRIRGNNRAQLLAKPIIYEEIKGENKKTAVIATCFENVQTDIAIYKPEDMTAPLSESFKNGKFEKYLYYPAFVTEKDLWAFDRLLKETKFDGIYAENYGGIIFAEARNLKVFAGTGFNVMNRLTLSKLFEYPQVVYYTVSKEANGEEMRALISEKSFALASGNIKIMDLCYCPFGKTCSVCDKRKEYSLTDENGRVFPVRRYVSADGACRFEVYNCADLIGSGCKGAGKLLDLTLVRDKTSAIAAQNNENQQKQIYTSYTSGHYKRGVL